MFHFFFPFFAGVFFPRLFLTLDASLQFANQGLEVFLGLMVELSPVVAYAGEPSHSNRVVVEDWYSNDELLTQYVSDWEFESAFGPYV